MARPRTVSDETILDAALVIVRESGPDALSFGRLAARVGLAGSTIVQRFGSKPNLLRAALSVAWDRLDADTALAVDGAGRGAPGVVDLLVSLSGQYTSDDFADQLMLLREDLRDPVLRERGQAWIGVLAVAIEDRLRTPRRDVGGLGHLIVTHWQGTLTVWAFERSETIADSVRASLERLCTRLRLT